MNVNAGIKQAAILAIGIIALGFCIKSGLEGLAGKDRKVVVKGLAEKEVEADKVTWPILSKEIGNDLPELYQKINTTSPATSAAPAIQITVKIQRFLNI